MSIACILVKVCEFVWEFLTYHRHGIPGILIHIFFLVSFIRFHNEATRQGFEWTITFILTFFLSFFFYTYPVRYYYKNHYELGYSWHSLEGDCFCIAIDFLFPMAVFFYYNVPIKLYYFLKVDKYLPIFEEKWEKFETFLVTSPFLLIIYLYKLLFKKHVDKYLVPRWNQVKEKIKKTFKKTFKKSLDKDPPDKKKN